MKKIIIIGSGGAGKSTLALELGNRLNLPVYHLDKLFWKPGWVESERAEFNEKQLTLLKQNEWIIDGNFDNTLPLRLEYCDTVIFLDYSRFTCYTGYFKRYLKFKGKTRASMTEGCEEKLDMSYLKWLWNFPKIKGKIVSELERNMNGKNIYTFKSRKETKRFINSIQR